MFREMRRKDKALTNDDAIAMLNEASFGTLAINSVEGYPYSLPISYTYEDGKIYFHGAKSGLKFESLKNDGKVSFSVVTQDDVQPSGFTTLYKSVVLYGICRIVTDEEELKKTYDAIIKKYSLGFEKEGAEFVRKQGPATTVFCIDIEHMTAKG